MNNLVDPIVIYKCVLKFTKTYTNPEAHNCLSILILFKVRKANVGGGHKVSQQFKDMLAMLKQYGNKNIIEVTQRSVFYEGVYKVLFSQFLDPCSNSGEPQLTMDDIKSFDKAFVTYSTFFSKDAEIALKNVISEFKTDGMYTPDVYNEGLKKFKKYADDIKQAVADDTNRKAAAIAAQKLKKTATTKNTKPHGQLSNTSATKKNATSKQMTNNSQVMMAHNDELRDQPAKMDVVLSYAQYYNCDAVKRLFTARPATATATGRKFKVSVEFTNFVKQLNAFLNKHPNAVKYEYSTKIYQALLSKLKDDACTTPYTFRTLTQFNRALISTYTFGSKKTHLTALKFLIDGFKDENDFNSTLKNLKNIYDSTPEVEPDVPSSSTAAAVSQGPPNTGIVASATAVSQGAPNTGIVASAANLPEEDQVAKFKDELVKSIINAVLAQVDNNFNDTQLATLVGKEFDKLFCAMVEISMPDVDNNQLAKFVTHITSIHTRLHQNAIPDKCDPGSYTELALIVAKMYIKNDSPEKRPEGVSWDNNKSEWLNLFKHTQTLDSTANKASNAITDVIAYVNANKPAQKFVESLIDLTDEINELIDSAKKATSENQQFTFSTHTNIAAADRVAGIINTGVTSDDRKTKYLFTTTLVLKLKTEVYLNQELSIDDETLTVKDIDENTVTLDDSTVHLKQSAVAFASATTLDKTFFTRIFDRESFLKANSNILLKLLNELKDDPIIFPNSQVTTGFKQMVTFEIQRRCDEIINAAGRAMRGGKRRTLKKRPKKTAKHQPRVVRKSSRMNKKRSMKR